MYIKGTVVKMHNSGALSESPVLGNKPLFTCELLSWPPNNTQHALPTPCPLPWQPLACFHLCGVADPGHCRRMHW